MSKLKLYTKYLVYIFLFLLAVNLSTWLILGKGKLLNDSVQQVWSSENVSDLQKVTTDFREIDHIFILCSNINEDLSKKNERFNFVRIENYQCTNSDTLHVLEEESSWEGFEDLPDGTREYVSGGGIFVTYVLSKVSYPFFSKTRIGYHVYGTDFDAICDETNIWLFNKWHSLQNESWGLGTIDSCLNRSSKYIYGQNDEFVNPWKLNS